MIGLDQLSGDARVWVFGATSALSDAQANAVIREANRFLQSWSAHGTALRAAAGVIEDALLVIALEEGNEASGCSIDSLYRFVRNIGLLDAGRIFYRTADGIRSASRAEFRDLLEQGSVSGDTIVIDTTVERLGDINSGAWQKRLADSWHAAAFAPRAATAG